MRATLLVAAHANLRIGTTREEAGAVYRKMPAIGVGWCNTPKC